MFQYEVVREIFQMKAVVQSRMHAFRASMFPCWFVQSNVRFVDDIVQHCCIWEFLQESAEKCAERINKNNPETEISLMNWEMLSCIGYYAKGKPKFDIHVVLKRNKWNLWLNVVEV